MNLRSMEPSSIRTLLRNGEHRREPTTYWAEGYKQTNLAILPSKLAKDFEEFARGNIGALPLLYVSNAGELSAGYLGKNSDVRTDAPAYQIVANKTRTIVDNLLEFDWSDMVTFYIGCSFSFTQILVENKLLTPSTKGVSIFRTNIDCYESGPFKCKMVVSMKAISKHALSKIHKITSKFPDVHGAPIHYGNPARIGIPDINDCIGDTTDFVENDVAVFWCCGFTAVEALMQANVERAFTHGPNSVFVTDVKQEAVNTETDPNDRCEVVEYSKDMYSAISAPAIKAIEAIYDIIKSTAGYTGSENFVPERVFLKASLAFSHSTKVGIVTGCPMNQNQDFSDTDCIPGALSLAAALQTLGKTVDILTDTFITTTTKNIIARCVENELLRHTPRVAAVKDCTMFNSESIPHYDVLVLLQQGNLTYNSKKCCPSLQAAINHPDIVTIEIGYNGRDITMRNNEIPTIDANIPAANLSIAGGISNCAFYGLALSLHLTMSCPIHERYIRRAVGFPVNVSAMMKNALPSLTRIRQISALTKQLGLRNDGNHDSLSSADGKLFDEEYEQAIRSMLDIVAL